MLASPVLRRQVPGLSGRHVLLRGQSVLLRPLLHLRHGRRRVRALRLLLPRSHRRAAAPGLPAGHHPLPRLADRHDPRAAQYPVPPLPLLQPNAHGLHHPQPAVPGHLRHQGRAGHPGPGRQPVHRRQARVLRLRELPEGRPGLRRRDHHRQPQLRRGDPDRLLRRAAGGPAARAPQPPDGHPQRHRRGRLRPRKGSHDLRQLRRVLPGRQGVLQGVPAARAGPDRRRQCAGRRHGHASVAPEGPGPGGARHPRADGHRPPAGRAGHGRRQVHRSVPVGRDGLSGTRRGALPDEPPAGAPHLCRRGHVPDAFAV